MNIPPCPNCGNKDWVYICEQWQGPVHRYFNLTGELEDTSLDEMKTVSRSKHVRCCSCRKIRKDLRFNDDKFEIVKIGS